MPAGSPPGGLDRRFIIGDRLLRNTGAVTTPNYRASAINPANDDIFIAGNLAYNGLMSDGIFGELVQGAAAIASGMSIDFAALNKDNGGWLVADTGNNIFRGTANLSAWVDITPPAVLTRRGVIEWNGRILSATQHLAAPDRQIEFSDDNGATWDSNPGIDTGTGNDMRGFATNFARNVLVCYSQGGTDAAFTTAVDAATGTWTLIPVNTLGVPMNHAAVSDSGREGVIVVSNGQITTTDDRWATTFNFPDDDNPFVAGATGTAIQSVVYIAGLGGFLMVGVGGTSMAFIAETNMQQIFVGSYLGSGVAVTVHNAISDGEQALFGCNANEAMVTLRETGQLGKT